MSYIKLLLAFAVFGFLDAKVIPGRCPKVSTMLDFDPIPVSMISFEFQLAIVVEFIEYFISYGHKIALVFLHLVLRRLVSTGR